MSLHSHCKVQFNSMPKYSELVDGVFHPTPYPMECLTTYDRISGSGCEEVVITMKPLFWM